MAGTAVAVAGTVAVTGTAVALAGIAVAATGTAVVDAGTAAALVGTAAAAVEALQGTGEALAAVQLCLGTAAGRRWVVEPVPGPAPTNHSIALALLAPGQIQDENHQESRFLADDQPLSVVPLWFLLGPPLAHHLHTQESSLGK